MDQTTINIIIGSAMAALGWFARTLWDAQKELRADLNKLQVTVGTDYVSFNALRDVLRDLKEDLQYIRDRVDAVTEHRRKGDE